jgi:hypothetical protein
VSETLFYAVMGALWLFGLRGADVARQILDANGLENVRWWGATPCSSSAWPATSGRPSGLRRSTLYSRMKKLGSRPPRHAMIEKG